VTDPEGVPLAQGRLIDEVLEILDKLPEEVGLSSSAA
jgi:hypothetical protein